MKNFLRKMVFALIILTASGLALATIEDDLPVCKDDKDCVVVPYSHCCGGPKSKAINKAHLKLYNSKPKWQKFNDPQKCATMGFCGEDAGPYKAVCLRVGKSSVGSCQLQPTSRQ